MPQAVGYRPNAPSVPLESLFFSRGNDNERQVIVHCPVQTKQISLS